MKRMLGATVTLLVLACGACDPEALLGPDAPQGIEGQALRGPICPVVTQDQDCDDRPHEARIDVRDAAGRRVARIQTGVDGRFRVGLRPGRYRLVPESGDPFPVASEQSVDVEAGAYAQVTLFFDTGIR